MARTQDEKSMNENEVIEIINYINSKYHERVPSLIRGLVKGKIKKIENLQMSELPFSLRRCTVEELVQIVQDGLKRGLVKL